MEFVLTEAFYNTLMPLLGAIIVAVLTILGNKLLVKLNLQGKIDLDRHIQDLSYLAISLAKEKSADHIKKYGEKLDSSVKLSIAVSFLLDRIPTLTHAQARMFIEAALGYASSGASSIMIEPVAEDTPDVLNE